MRSATGAEAGGLLSLASSPIFSGPRDHRPAVPSPLASSPIRASSPLSPMDKNALPQRQVQSSPIPPPKFKYGARPARPNPLVRSPEAARHCRRQNFLQRVRQKTDDKAWQRRDVEGQFLKNSWLANIGRLSHDAPALSEEDLADAMAFQQETPQQPAEEDEDMDDDSCREQQELDAMAASYAERPPRPPLPPSQRPPSPTLMSDDEYDEIFAELALQDKSPNLPDQMDMTDDG